MNVIVDTIRSYLPPRRKRTSAGWESFNCPACVLMGEPRPDTRSRGGIIFTSTGGVSYHCFNCKLKAHWEPGSSFSKKFELLLKSFGISQTDLRTLRFKAWQMRGQVEQNIKVNHPPKTFEINFKSMELPFGAKSFEEWAEVDSPPQGFIRAAEYINMRGESFLKAYTYYWTPNLRNNLNRRVIIPFYWNDTIVGYTARLFAETSTGNISRYFSQMQENYLFNNKALYFKNRNYAILVEGVFDAIAVDGIGILGSTLSQKQIDWINTSELDIVLVPQRDSGTEELITIAIEQGWSVSFPDTAWEEDINDVAAATSRYGRIYTLKSILDNIVVDKIVIKSKFDMLRFNRRAYNKNR